MISLPKDVTLVMVEDDEGHARLIEKNLRRGGITNRLIHLSTGSEAVEFFFGPQALMHYGSIVVLLDLNLPEIDGYEILARMKSDERTRKLPVVILTTTENPKEIERCYALGCNVYITKPVEYEDFAESIRKLGLLLAVVQLPQTE